MLRFIRFVLAIPILLATSVPAFADTKLPPKKGEVVLFCDLALTDPELFPIKRHPQFVDTATRQQLKNFNDLSADIVTKGQGPAPQAHLQGELQ